jgi:hypothetical protein
MRILMIAMWLLFNSCHTSKEYKQFKKTVRCPKSITHYTTEAKITQWKL